MANVLDIVDSLVRFPISYGKQPVRGWRIKHSDAVVGGGTQRTLQQALGEGPWDGVDKLWTDAFEILSADYIFHNGTDVDSSDANFPSDPAHPWTSYLSAKAKAGLTDAQTDELFGIYRTLRTPNYNGSGQQLDSGGSIVSPSDPRTAYFFKPNPANCALDQLLRWGKRLPGIVNFPAWVDWRDFNDELIWWDDTKYTPRSLSLTPSGGGSLTPGQTYYVRVSTMRSGDQSSASQKTIETYPHSITLAGGQTSFQVSWLIKGDELQPAAPPGDMSSFRVYIGTVPGVWLGYFTVANPALRTLLITTTAGVTAGPPLDQASSGLLRQIKRFYCGKFFFPPYDLATALDQICQISCADWQWSGLGTNTYRNDKVRFLSPANRAPVFTLNLAETGMGTFSATQVDRRSRYNQIIVNFRDLDDDFLAAAQPVILNRELLQASDGQIKGFAIDGGTMYRSQAQRMASFFSRVLCDQDRFAGMRGSPKSYHVLPADTLLVTNDTPDWVDKKFVVRRKLENIDKIDQDQLVLQEYVDNTYSDTDHSPLPAPLRHTVVVLPGAGFFTSTSVVGGHSANGDYIQTLKAIYTFPTFTTEPLRARVYLTPPGGVEEDVGLILEPDVNNQAFISLTASRGKGNYTVRVLAEIASTGIPGTTSVSTVLVVGTQVVVLADIPNDTFWITPGFKQSPNYYSWDASPDEEKGKYEVYQTLTGAIAVPFTFYWTGGTPSNLLFRGTARQFQIIKDDPNYALNGAYARLVDSMGNYSRWLQADYVVYSAGTQAAPVVSTDVSTTSPYAIGLHLATSLTEFTVDGTRVQIRATGGSWPATTENTDGQKYVEGIHREMQMDWRNGGSVDVRARYEPNGDWSNTITYTLPTVSGGTGADATSYKGNSAPSATEFSYLSGVTSAIQTQLNARLTIANNLSDLANAATSRSNLGVAIGSNVQAWDADLDAIAALAGTSGLLKKTAANTWALDTSTYATQAYADALVVGLLDDRGNYDASVNTFPATGGSGAAGAILKGDIWFISVAGTLGGVAVNIGDQVRALVDTPGQTAANWAVAEANIGYVPLNQALANGKIYVGNGSGIGTAVTLSGDVTMSNAGVTAIGAGKVTNAMLVGGTAAAFLFASLILTGDSAVNGPSISNSFDGLLLVGGTTEGVRINNQNNTAELVRVTNDGKVGIGLIPTQPLEVGGNALINAATANLFLKDISTGWQSATTLIITPQANNTIRSTSYTSGLVGWNISAAGTFEANNIDVRGSIHAGVIAYNAILATAGTQAVLPSAAKLKSDIVVTAAPTYGTTTFNIDVVDQDGLSHAASQLFVVNDILRLKDGLVGDTWFKVTAVSDQTTFWRYTASIQAGTGNITYRAGLGVGDYGVSGKGGILLTADQTNAPYLQMFTHAATFSSADASGTLTLTPQLRLGNLNGAYGFSSDTYGFGAGQYGTASKAWLTVEQTNGIRIGNNTTTLAQWDTSGNILVGRTGASQSNVYITSGSVDLRNNTTPRIHLASDGSGYLANSLIAWDTSGNLTITGNATIGGLTIGSSKLYLGTGTFASSNTAFYVDTSGQFSLKDRFVWDGTNLSLGGLVPKNVSGGTFSGGVFTKTATDAWGNSGYSSTASIVGDGYIQWIASSVVGAAGQLMVGLSTSDPDTSNTSIQYAWSMGSDSNAYIFESGTLKLSDGAITASTTVFKIERVGTTLTYYKDGVSQRVVTSITTSPLFADVAVWSINATVNPIKMVSGGVVVGALQWDGTTLSVLGAITATSGSINGPMTMSGATSSISIGTTPPTSASAGTGLWLGPTGMYGLASSVVQAKFDAVTGAITAGGGVVALNVSGLSITDAAAKTAANTIRFLATDGGGGIATSIYDLNASGSTTHQTFIEAENLGTNTSMFLRAITFSGTGQLYLEAWRGGSAQDYIKIDAQVGTTIVGAGVMIGAPTGGAKGSGTINLAGDIYKNGTAYTNPDYVLEHWATGKIEKFADKEGASDYAGLMPLADFREFVRSNYHLPRFGQNASHGLFNGGDKVLVALEEAFLYIFQLEDRIKHLKETT